MNLDWSALHQPVMHWPIWHLPKIPDWCFPLFICLFSLWLCWNGLRDFEKGQMTLPRGGGLVYRDKQPILFWIATACTAIYFFMGLGSSVLFGETLIQQHLLSSCAPKNAGSAEYYRTIAANCLGPAHSSLATRETKLLAFENRGFSLLRAGAYQAAIADLSSAISLESKDQWAFYTRGLANFRAGKVKDATSDFDAALTLNPDDLEALRSRADTNLARGQATKAIADLSRVAAVKPNDSAVWRALSYAHAEKGDCTAAFAFADKSLALGEKSFWPFEAKARCYDRMGRTDNALDEYAKAIAVAPNDPQPYEMRANLNFRVDNYPAAIDDLSQALHITPKNTALLYQRCWFRALADLQTDAALGDCNEALKTNADSQVVLEARILVLYRLKQYAATESECGKLLVKHQESSTAYYIRGLARKRLGNKYGDGDIGLAREIDSGDVSSLTTYGFKL